MRVIAGMFRSRLLNGPGKLRLRPTSDRLRETLFNILGPSVVDSLFVDFYAGTGAIGIEAISRGAREAIFIESHAATARLLRQNLEALGVRGGAEVVLEDAARGLKRLAARGLKADFVFLDPPYQAADELARMLNLIDSSHLIAPCGLVIAEHHCGTKLPEQLARLARSRLVEQGDAALSFYRLATAP